MVPAEAIFEFDARCPGCGEVLILEDDEDEFTGDESGVEFDFRERPTLIDEDVGDFRDGLPPSELKGSAEVEGDASFTGHSSPFQGIGMNDQAGMDILALAASALDPDVDLSEHQFGGVREVPEVRLGESGEILPPTDSDRLRRVRTGSGRLPKSSNRLQRQPKSSSRLQRQPKSSDRLQRQPKSSDRLQRQSDSGRLLSESESSRQTRVGSGALSRQGAEAGSHARSDSGPLRPLNDSTTLRREVEELKQSLAEDALRTTSSSEPTSAEDALLAAAELYRPSQRLSFDELPPESDESALLPSPEEESLVSPAAPTQEAQAPPGETAEMFRPRESVALLRGEPPTAPPLPSWEGGDTQQVGELAKSDPSGEALLPPLVEFEDSLAESEDRPPMGLESDPAAQPLPETLDESGIPLPEPEADLDELADLVELPARGSSGRMSRVYDASQVVGADGQVTLPPDPGMRPLKPQALSSGLAETIPPDDGFLEIGAQIPSPSGSHLIVPGEGGWGPETEKRISQLFQDAEWLALLDDTLTEVEGEGDMDEDGRHVIRLSQTTAAETAENPERMREAQSTLERDGAAALEALLLGSTSSDSRVAARFPKDALQPPTTQFSRGDVDATKTFKSETEEAEGSSTQSFHTEASPEVEPAKPKQKKEGAPDTQVWKNSAPTTSQNGERPRSSTRLRALSPSEIRPRMVVERFHRSQLDPGLVCVSDVEAPESDLFRQLYEQVFHGAYREEDRDRGRVILVTSARPAEGKTIVASNLAVVGARVPGEGAVLVNADPRGRGILPAFGQRTPTEGLLEALSTDRDPTRFVVRLRLKELDVIPLGLRGSNAAELIASDSMRDFIENLRRVYPRQSILIDGSSVLGAADPLALARMVDKVLLVVRARKTSKADVEQAIRLIGKSRLAGIVLNDAAEAA